MSDMNDVRREIDARARKAARRTRSLNLLGFVQTPTQQDLDTVIIERIIDIESRLNILDAIIASQMACNEEKA